MITFSVPSQIKGTKCKIIYKMHSLSRRRPKRSCQYSTLSSFEAHLWKADNASLRIKWSHLMERSL